VRVWGELNVLGHAILAFEITAVGEGEAEVVVATVELVKKGFWLARLSE